MEARVSIPLFSPNEPASWDGTSLWEEGMSGIPTNISLEFYIYGEHRLERPQALLYITTEEGITKAQGAENVALTVRKTPMIT